MFATLLILLAVTAIAVANNPPTHKILVFRNGDLVTNDNPLSNVEVHCFELNNNGEPTYVRGTYGNRGYFEGSVNNWGAFVNYQEISATPEGLTPVAGSGYLGYKDTWEYSSGMFWPSGVQSEITPLTSWGISGPCTEGLHPCTGTDNSVDEAAIAMQFCFWDITNTLGHSRDNINYKPWTVIGYQNPSTWYKLSVGFQEAFGGALAGAYRYTYYDDDCNTFPTGCTSGRVEWGIYSQETAISGFKTSLGIATEWKATTGPITGQSGSALYGIVAGPDGKAKQIGFFCNSKINQDPNIDAKKVLTTCSPEPGQIQLPDTEGNRKLSKTLLKNYARKEYAYWWRNLFSFIDAVWGEHVHAQDSLTSEEIASAEADNTVKAVQATPVAAAVPPSA